MNRRASFNRYNARAGGRVWRTHSNLVGIRQPGGCGQRVEYAPNLLVSRSASGSEGVLQRNALGCRELRKIVLTEKHSILI